VHCENSFSRVCVSRIACIIDDKDVVTESICSL
jgi:hypothetical protein